MIIQIDFAIIPCSVFIKKYFKAEGALRYAKIYTKGN